MVGDKGQIVKQRLSENAKVYRYDLTSIVKDEQISRM